MTLPPGWRPQPPEVKPGIIPLRSLGVGEILTGSFATLRRYWRPLIAVSASVSAVAIVALIPALLAARPLVKSYLTLAAVEPDESTSQFEDLTRSLAHEFLSFSPWLILFIAVTFIAYTVIDAGSAVVTSRAVLGQDITPGEVLNTVWRAFPRLIGLAFVAGISITAGLVLCVVPGLLLSVAWFAAAPALILEPASITGALGRSWTLVSGSFWRVLGIVLLVQVILGVAVQVISTPLSIISSVGLINGINISPPSDGQVQLILATYVLSIAIALFLYPFASIARTLLYFDLRMRKEKLAETLTIAAKDVGR